MSQDLTLRGCKYNDAPNCSVAQIREGRVFVFGSPIYNIADDEIDYSKGQVAFYKEVDGWHSLNQAIEQNDISQTVLLLPLNIAFEIFECFKEVNKENERRLSRLFT